MLWDPSHEFFLAPKFRFTQPGVFNDPFEGQKSSASMLKILEMHNGNGELTQQIEQFKKHGINLKYDNIGVLCLTTKPDNLLMWSHYAQNHEGFVLELDISHPFFNQKIKKYDSDETCSYSGRPLKVQYRTDRYEGVWKNDYIHDALLVKSIEWSYEEEYRMFHNLSEADNDPIQTDEEDINNQKSIVLFNIPPECIKRVFIGCRATEKNSRGTTNRNEIIEQINTANKGQYNNIEVYDVKLHQNQFQLNFQPIGKTTYAK